MSVPVFAAVVVIVLAAFAGGYVWGWLNGSASAQHPDGPETRAKLRAAERTAETYKARARQLEGKVMQLEHSFTVTGEWLLDELEKARRTPAAVTAAGVAPDPLALPAGRR
jgi:hypothetical protein